VSREALVGTSFLSVLAREHLMINILSGLDWRVVYDPNMPRCPGRFYLETVAEAAALLDEALLILWGGGAQATAAVKDAPRGEVAAAIAQQASAWRADVIVLTRRSRPAISRMLLGSVADQVMRTATCPVLTVHPNRK
jgi:nucleotide-binding universal stress UspA family protein